MLTDSYKKISPLVNGGFKTYVLDHYDLILQSSTLYQFTLEAMFKFKYRPTEFLAHMGIPTRYTWVLLLINNIPNNTEFSDLESIYIPDAEYIQSLEHDYNSRQF